MKRREMLVTTGVAALGVAGFPLRWISAADQPKKKILYFTRCQGFEHSVVKRNGGQLSHSEKILTELGPKHGFEVVCSKDGGLFDGNLDQYAAIVFYTSGVLTKTGGDNNPVMSEAGKKKLLDAVAGGKGFVGIHAATDSFHTPGKSNERQKEVDPYIAMLGGEFIVHGAQQVAGQLVVSPKFPGLEKAPKRFELMEEWYALKNFADNLHVILVQDTSTMKGKMYERPPFPATWARMHQKGRVFQTSLGHREDVWTNPLFQDILLGGLAWAMGNVDADVAPNMDKVAPKGQELQN
jgi:uncharacterized protein